MSPPNIGLTFDREGAKRALGWNDAQVDDYLRRYPQGPVTPVQVQRPETGAPGQPIPSTVPSVVQHPDNAPTATSAPAGYGGQFVTGLTRAAAQGVTMGSADEIEAGARAMFGGGDYRTIRDKIRTANADFSRENPILATGANLAGGVATGAGVSAVAKGTGAVASMLRGSTLTPVALKAGASLPARIGSAALGGAAYGAAAGVGSAPEMGDIPESLKYSVPLGAAFGAGFGALGEGSDAARNIAAGGSQKTVNVPGVGALSVGAEAPAQAGARRVLRMMNEHGVSIDDLATASAGAHPETAIAELIPNAGVKGLRVARNMGRERDAIDHSLTERANEEPANWSRTLANTTGVPEARDPIAVSTEALDKVKPEVARLSGIAGARPDIDSPEVAKVIGELHTMGEDGVLARTGKLAVGRNTLSGDGSPTTKISVKNLQFLRRSLDRRIEEYGAMNPPDKDMADILRERRQVVDRVLKQAGGPEQAASDKLWEDASKVGESFTQGARVEQAPTAEAVTRLKKEARDPEAFRLGAASQLQARAANISDGEAGQVRNPVQGPLGSVTRRSRTAAAFLGPEESPGVGPQAAFPMARGEAADMVGRLNTRRLVSSNSTTAANLSEMADEFMANPAELAKAIFKPTSGLRIVGEKVMRGGMQGLNTAQATQMGKILSGGLPGQMSRDEAIAIIRNLEPSVREKLATEIARRAGAGGAAARMATEKTPAGNAFRGN